MTILEKIEAHKQAILSNKMPEDLTSCPHCNQSPPAFKPHDVRPRLLYVILDSVISHVRILIERFKCTLCKQTFSYYPVFVLPYKRYTKDTILQLSRRYVEDDTMTYQKAVQEDGASIAHESTDEATERYLSGSTVHRWLSWIGSLKGAFRNALSLIKERSPSSHIFRKIRPIAPKKCRSEKRQKLLDRCIRLFNAEDEYTALFSRTIFPRFAIKIT